MAYLPHDSLISLPLYVIPQQSTVFCLLFFVFLLPRTALLFKLVRGPLSTVICPLFFMFFPFTCFSTPIFYYDLNLLFKRVSFLARSFGRVQGVRLPPHGGVPRYIEYVRPGENNEVIARKNRQKITTKKNIVPPPFAQTCAFGAKIFDFFSDKNR